MNSSTEPYLRSALLRIEAAGADQDAASDLLHLAGADLLRVGPTFLVAQISDAEPVIEATIRELERFGEIQAVRA